MAASSPPSAARAPPPAQRLDPVTKELVGGLLAGASNVTAGYAFDTVKVRLQTTAAGGGGGSAPRYAGSLDCLRTILRTEGVAGLYRGLSPPLIGGAAETGVNYLVYSRTLEWLRPGSARGSDAQLAAVPLAASLAGVALSFVLGPTELIKCRLQMAGSAYSGPLHCVATTVRREGLRGLTRGLGATIIREIPGNVVFFTTYELLRRALPSSLWGSSSGGSSGNHGSGNSSAPSISAAAAAVAVAVAPPQQHVSSSLALDRRRGEQQQQPGTSAASALLQSALDASVAVTCGGLAGMAMWAVVLPLDVAKTRLQTAEAGSAWDVGVAAHLRLLWREGRWRALYTGFAPTMIRAFPANAAQWLVWELWLKAPV